MLVKVLSGGVVGTRHVSVPPFVGGIVHSINAQSHTKDFGMIIQLKQHEALGGGSDSNSMKFPVEPLPEKVTSGIVLDRILTCTSAR